METVFRRFRDFVGWSQEQLGAALGVRQSTISNYENRERMPELSVARRFLALAKRHKFRCTLDDVYPEELVEAKST